MTKRYTAIDNTCDAKVHDGYLYVRTTGCNYQGMLVQGDFVGTIYRMPFNGTLVDALAYPHDDDEYLNAIGRCTMGGKGEIVKRGRRIY